MAKNKLPILEEFDSDKKYDLVSLLQTLKDESLDSTKIMKIRNMLNVDNNGKIVLSDIENVLYLMGSTKLFIDQLITKLKQYDIPGK